MVYVYNASYEQSSYGIRILYTLVETLNKQGYTRAKIVCWEAYSEEIADKIPLRYRPIVLYENFNFQAKDIKDDDIVVYPDVVPGNPLKAKRVVRYLLNRPYYLNKQGIEYGETDFLMSYSKIIDDTLPQLFLLNDDRHLYKDKIHVAQKNQVALYFGKINPNLLLGKFKEIKRLLRLFENVVIITRSYPTSKLELINILKSSRLLVSFDPLSNLSYEATLCGTPALVFDKSFSDTSKKFNLPLYGVMDDIRHWPEAKNEVSLAISTYEKELELQESAANKMFQNIDRHFRNIEKRRVEGYFERNSLLNKLQFELDIARARIEMNSRQLTNVYFIDQIPKKIRNLVLKKTSRQYIRMLDEIERRTPNLREKLKSFIEYTYKILRKIYRKIFKGTRASAGLKSERRSNFEISKEELENLKRVSAIDKTRIKYAICRGYPLELIADLMIVDIRRVKELGKSENSLRKL